MSVVNIPEVPKPNGLLSIRHLQSTMYAAAMLLSFGSRTCMSIAVVAMTDKDLDNTFNWSLKTQSLLVSGHKYSYIVMLLFAGQLSARFGGRAIIIISIAVTSVLSFFIPPAAHWGGWQAVFTCRIVQGAAQGLLYPSVHHMMAKWIPPEERSRTGSTVYASSMLGSAVELITAGFIADYWGWPGIFHVLGVAGSVWTLVYIFVGASSPQDSKLISKEERLYIQTSLEQVGGDKKKLKTPWKAMLTSVPLLAIMIATIGFNVGNWTLLSEIPTYMKHVLGVNIKKNGVLSSLPYIVSYIMSYPFGFLCDFIYIKGWLSVTTCRKLFTGIGLYSAGFSLIILCFAPVTTFVSMTLFTVGIGLSSAHYTGHRIAHLDLAPNYAGTMMGLCTAMANVFSVNANVVAAVIIQDETDAREWHKVFYVAAAIFISTCTFFVIFGSSKLQPWNDPDWRKEKKEKGSDLRS